MEKYSYFYVLYCKDGTLYGGYTIDLARRLKEHNSGKGAKYTRPQKRRPAKYLYAEAYPSKSEAMRAEYAFKALTRQDKEAYLNHQGVCRPYNKINEVVLNYNPKEDHHAESEEL